MERGNLAAAFEGVGTSAVTHLSYDSRCVKPGTLFFCKGAHFEPEYVVQAVRAGALAYVSECDYTAVLESAGFSAVPVLLVQELRTALGDIAALFYRGLLNHLTLIGFTGTKGKSTTTYLLKAILDSWLAEQGKEKCAWLSSIENYDGVELTRSLLTTQDVLELYAHFNNAVESNIAYLVMEVSSQALKYGRTHNLWFEVAGFLNIGEDHISDIEHPNHEDYFASKLSIFSQSGTAVINEDSCEAQRILVAAEQCETVLTYGHGEQADMRAGDVEATASGLSFGVACKDWGEQFTLPMAGLFNVENALAALTAAYALGIPVKHMQAGLAHCQVSGRMELIAGPDDKLIIVDYAHNKMSFQTLFETVSKDYPGRTLVSVFGATGGKGIERRLDLPAVAVKYASMIYVTEDDPGEEPLAQINQQIAEVVEKAGCPYSIVEDRSQAIERAIIEAPQGSVVLILGKGHETVMKRGRESVPVLSDAECAKQVCQRGV